MASTTEQRLAFETLVKKAEAELGTNPAAYRRRIALLAVLGYAAIFGLLTLLILLLGGGLAAAMFSSTLFILLFKTKLIAAVVVPIWILARSLFVRVKAPQGYPLDRKGYPVLWQEIDALRAKLSSLPIHEVVLTPQMNAAVSQTPRLGIFGPYKNTLVLGLELLMSLTPEQMRAVLAHEFGHLSHKHGRFGTWIYRKRLTWARIGAAFEQSPAIGSGLLRRFMGWYIPRLAGYSFALARQQEYEADAAAAQLTSPEHMATALVHVEARAPVTGEMFWKRHWQRAMAEPEPDKQTYSRLFEFLRASPPEPGLALDKLNAAMRQKTDYTDTHPALRDRLAALKQPAAFAFGKTVAAEAWLGPGLATILPEFDRRWLADSRENWASRHKYAQAALARLNELMLKADENLSETESWQKANLVEDFRPDLDPVAAFRAHHVLFPADARANLAIGRLLLDKHKDPQGLQHLEAAALQPMLREPACAAIANFHSRYSRTELAEAWLREAEAAHDENLEARRERSAIRHGDTFKPSRLDDAGIRLVADALKASSIGAKIKKAWIAEKTLTRYPEDGFHIILIEPKSFARGAKQITEILAKELPSALSLPGTWFFVVAGSSTRILSRRIKSAGRALSV